MKINDLLSIRGSLRIIHIPGACYDDPSKALSPDAVDKLCRQGVAHASPIYENLVVDTGLEIIRALLGFGQSFPTTGAFGVQDPSDLRIATMRIGNASTPAAPAAGDVDISVVPATYTIPFVSVFYPTTSACTLAGVIPQAESTLDGVGITEEGAFAFNGAMLARVTFPAEVKIPTNALQFEHTITVARP
ncbi:MAG TPA: hypothetical protein VMY39_09540 [Planctomycetota bacterium]|nr:hypothetical protein [Planctomycetota bacterium]